MIGSTRPTAGNGGYNPGTFNGSMAVDFATRRVGLNFAVTMGEFAWNLSTSGGTTNPANSNLSLSVNNQVKDTVQIIGTTPASWLQQCSASVDGFLFGPGASHFGITYGITDRQSSSEQLWVSGAAAFEAVRSASGSAGTGLTTASALPVTAAAPADWDRWTVSDAATLSSGNGMTMVAPGLDQLAASGIQFSPEQMVQLEAHIAAQRR
jgi:hypothetical protein